MKRNASADIPAGMALDPWLPSTALRVWIVYRLHANEDMETTISREEVAEQIGIHLSSVRESIKYLTEAGYMTRVGNTHRRKLVAK
jgi:Mn-dependent DtxR family transcriptional regulator